MKKREIIEKVKSIILKHSQPIRIYLFGSQLSDDKVEPMDIDIAYDAPNSKRDILIKDEVQELKTLFKIDVVNIAKTDNRISQRVKDTGKIIWSSTLLLRFEDGLINFSNALQRFSETIQRKQNYENDGYGDVYLDIAIKRFEFTFEMSWKACKRALAYLGFTCKTPRECLREAFAQKIIQNETIWLEMLEQRNLSAHIYDEVSISEINKDITNYLTAFIDLKDILQSLFDRENNN